MEATRVRQRARAIGETLAAFLALTKDAWTILGAVILLMAVLESLLTFYYKKTDEEKFRKEVQSVADSGVYKNAPWTSDLLGELFHHHRTALPWAPYTHTHGAMLEGKYVNGTESGTRKTWNSDAPITSAGRSLKISFFGGSNAWGFGSRDDFTIPSLVSKKLSGHGISAVVTNHAVSGDSTTQSLVRFILEVREKGAPDLVVFYGGLIDAKLACRGERPGAPLGNSYLDQVISGKRPDASARTVASLFIRENLALIRVSRDIGRHLRKTLSPGKDAESKGCKTKMDTLSDETLDVYLKNAAFLSNLSSKLAFGSLIYLEPQRADKAARTVHEENRLLELENAVPGVVDLYSLTREKLADRQRQGTERNRIHDLRTIFANVSGVLFIDDQHYGEEANEIVSTMIAADVEALYSPAR